MKRSTKIFALLVLALIVTIWASTIYEFSTIMTPYLVMIFALACHAAYTILGSIFKLKDHPE